MNEQIMLKQISSLTHLAVYNISRTVVNNETTLCLEIPTKSTCSGIHFRQNIHIL